MRVLALALAAYPGPAHLQPKIHYTPDCLHEHGWHDIAGAISLTLVYPLDYARTVLAADIGRAHDAIGGGGGKRAYRGLADCLAQTIRTNGVLALYEGFSLSVEGIFVYRGPFFGLFRA